VLAICGYSSWKAAGASAHGLTTGFVDYKFLLPDPTTRALWLDRARKEGGEIVRLNVVWRNIAPDPPSNPTDPADPAYRWTSLDRAVRDGAARGLEIMFTVFYAPRWAQGPNRAPGAGPGAWEPNPQAYGAFAKALATRYSGSFHDRHGALLPHVGVFEAWNEPNQNVYLAPQWTPGNAPNGPTLYRNLLNAFYAGVKSVQSEATVVGGATSPFGDPPGGPRMRPKTFLTHLFCLDGKLEPACGERAHLDVLSHHPISTFGGPGKPPGVYGDIVPENFRLVRRILRAAERAKRVAPSGHHNLWATEFWWISSPPVPPGSPFRTVSPRVQAKEIELTLYLLWRQGATVAINYAVGDPDPSVNSFTGTGIYFPDGQAKPAATAFRFPFVTHRGSHGKAVVAWGKAPETGKLKIRNHRRGSWRTVKRLNVHAGEVFTTKLGRHAGGTLRGSVGGVTSLSWHQR
jgi:hypothetical protein